MYEYIFKCKCRYKRERECSCEYCYDSRCMCCSVSRRDFEAASKMSMVLCAYEYIRK